MNPTATAVSEAKRLRAASFAAGVDAFVVPPMLVSITRHLDTTLGTTTLAISAYLMAYGGFQLVWAMAAERLGRGRVLRIGLGVAAAAAALAAIASGPAVLIGARAVSGAALAGVVPTCITHVSDRLHRDDRQRALASVVAGYSAGAALGTLLAGLAVATLGWRAGLIGTGAIAVIAWLAVQRIPVRAGASLQRRGVGGRLAVVFSDGRARAVLGVAVVEGAVIFGFVPFLAPALEAVGIDPGTASLVVACYGASVLAWTAVVARMLGRVGLRARVLTGAGMAMTGFAAAAVDPDPLALLGTGILLGGAMVFMHTAFVDMAANMVPDQRGTMIGLFATVVFCGSALASAALSGLADRGAFSLLFACGIAICVPAGTGVAVLATRLARAPVGRHEVSAEMH